MGGREGWGGIRSGGRLGGGGGGGGDVGGPPMVQCNGRSSCERRSPLFPTPGATQKPRSACQGQVTFLIYTPGLWTRTMQTHSSFGLCMHTDRHTHLCAHSASTVSQTGTEVGVGGGRATVAVYFCSLVFVLGIK